MTPTKAPRNWTYLTVLSITRLYLAGALAISFMHIVTTAHLLDLTGWQAMTTPFAIDGMAVLGLIGRSHRWEPSTRRAGLVLQAGAGAVSLFCNVYAGHTIGQRIYGALIVVLFVVAEWYANKLRPAPAAGTVDAKHAARSEAAKRGAETKRRNREAAERNERKRIREASRALRQTQAAA